MGASPISIGGTGDHVHLLLGLRGTHAVAVVVRDVKTATSAYSGENEQPIRLKASIVSGENEHIIR